MSSQEHHFRLLGQQVVCFLAKMDLLMRREESVDRGKKIAKLCNALELANDSAMRFGLDLECKGVKLRKIRRGTQLPSKERQP